MVVKTEEDISHGRDKIKHTQASPYHRMVEPLRRHWNNKELLENLLGFVAKQQQSKK